MSVNEVDSKYLIPIFDRLFCCLPNNLLRILRCKKEFQDPKDIRAEEHDVELEVEENGKTVLPPSYMFNTTGKDPGVVATDDGIVGVFYMKPLKTTENGLYPELHESNGINGNEFSKNNEMRTHI